MKAWFILCLLIYFFVADIRLIIDNCFKFNTLGSHVYILGQQFESFFNSKWAEKNSFLHQHGEAKVKTSSAIPYSEDDDDYDGTSYHLLFLIDL